MNLFPKISTKLLCPKHLISAHGEAHKFLSTWRKKRSITGYLKSGCVEPRSYKKRHDELEAEIVRRWYLRFQSKNAKPPCSPLEQPDFSYLPEEEKNFEIEEFYAILLLMCKCWDCRQALLRKRSFFE